QAAGFVPLPRPALHAALVDRAERMLHAASADGDPATARAVGRWLVDTHFTNPAALERTIGVLGPALARIDPDRGATALAALAAGYSAALQERTRAEQERITTAALPPAPPPSRRAGR